MTSAPFDVQIPATEIAIAEAVSVSDPDTADTLRRLAFERDGLKQSADAWRKACRFIYETAGEGGKRGRPIDCWDKRTWTRIVKLIAEAEDQSCYA